MEPLKPVPPSPKNICAVIVTYYPGDFLTRLHAIENQVAHIVVVDNGRNEKELERAKSSVAVPLELISNQTNRGIGAAFNQGIEAALTRDYPWVLLFDQDTIASENFVASLATAYDEFPDKGSLAIIGCNPFSYPGLDITPAEGRGWAPTKAVISSGSLISIESIRRIGFLRGEFFMDLIDFEFCLRARLAGFCIIEIQEPILKHSIGDPLAISIRWLARATSNHRPWRFYYMTRNLVILTRESFLHDPLWIWKLIYRRIKALILMVLFEKTKIQKLKYTMLGLYDGLTRRFDRNVT